MKHQSKNTIGDSAKRRLGASLVAVLATLAIIQNGAAVNIPSPEQFMEPPIEARPGAFWAWLNGNADLPQITRELRR